MRDVMSGVYGVCADCAGVIANADWTGLDYYYGAQAEERRRSIERGLDGRIWALLDDVDDFSTSWCDCCGSHLAGVRFDATILDND